MFGNEALLTMMNQDYQKKEVFGKVGLVWVQASPSLPVESSESLKLMGCPETRLFGEPDNGDDNYLVPEYDFAFIPEFYKFYLGLSDRSKKKKRDYDL